MTTQICCATTAVVVVPSYPCNPCCLILAHFLKTPVSLNDVVQLYDWFVELLSKYIVWNKSSFCWILFRSFSFNNKVQLWSKWFSENPPVEQSHLIHHHQGSRSNPFSGTEHDARPDAVSLDFLGFLWELLLGWAFFYVHLCSSTQLILGMWLWHVLTAVSPI